MAISGMPGWARAEFSGPQWADYQTQLRYLNKSRLPNGHFPRPENLQRILPGRVTTQSGLPVRFVPSGEIPGVAYEEHIYRTGEISTRPDNWHDLFNALVWCNFPRIKAAMNAAHFAQIRNRPGTNRGPRRDALTLFDECGVVVASPDTDLLQALAARDWPRAFQALADSWKEKTCVFVCGHAMLEKFLHPYKAMTAQALLLKLKDSQSALARTEILDGLDRCLSQKITSGELLRSSSELSPLPLAGIPGWWSASPQDEVFYSDQHVFRPPAAGIKPPKTLNLANI